MRHALLSLSALALLTACPPAPSSGTGDGGAPPDASTPVDGGGHPLADGGDGDDEDGGQGDGGLVDPSAGWTWIPVEGSRCASGATAGIGVNLSDKSDDLFIYLQGGGACWNQGTCVPSLLAYGPICHYGANICLYDGPGGTKPMATYVTHPDPFPADGGGMFPSELSLITAVRVFDRSDEENPFRDATFVYVPYCTGDLHGGDEVRTFAYKYDAFGAEQQYEFHFAGAANMERYLEELAALRPNPPRVWLTGTSAGGYGATLNFHRVVSRFPDAEVALLADSSPFVDTERHWETWRDTWDLQLPPGCADCDQGFHQLMAHTLATHDEQRIALLAFERDKVIRWFFHGGNGPEAALDPPASTYVSELDEIAALYDAHDNAAYFILPGEEHVMWGGYGTRKSDGSYTTPRASADGETDLKAWIDAWANDDDGWTSRR